MPILAGLDFVLFRCGNYFQSVTFCNRFNVLFFNLSLSLLTMDLTEKITRPAAATLKAVSVKQYTNATAI